MCKFLFYKSKQVRRKPKSKNRLPVDDKKLNMGNTYSCAPKYYYDIEFTCIDCGLEQNWTARQQKWWHEKAGGYFFATAVRCRECRKNKRIRSEESRKAYFEGMKKKRESRNKL